MQVVYKSSALHRTSAAALVDAVEIAMGRETYEAGMTVSQVARRAGIGPTQLFHWQARAGGALTAVEAGQTVVPAASSTARRQIRGLQRLFGKETLEAETLKAMEIARARNELRAYPLLLGDDR